MKANDYDVIVVGAGIVGLTLARELALGKHGRILVIEKEDAPGRHASGRNSGVAHAGIYYPKHSLKAKFCVDGHRKLLDYVDTFDLPVLRCGKVIVASTPAHQATLDTLLERAASNGVDARRISIEELAEIEPEARSHGFAIWSPKTAVVDSKAILHKLTRELDSLGVTLAYRARLTGVDPEGRRIRTSAGDFGYGYLFNTAGVFADRVAKMFGVGYDYRILPFKGLYWQAAKDFTAKIKRLIYPSPDVNMPFLGVHITRTVDGKVLFGPTAIPAFGRENYSLVGGLRPIETGAIGFHLLGMLARNPDNFRRYVTSELGRYWPENFRREAASLVRSLERRDIGEFYKVGIRAQLMNLRQKKLEMDFVLEPGPHSMHVLNAISPAFTCAFAFAPFLVAQMNRPTQPHRDGQPLAPP